MVGQFDELWNRRLAERAAEAAEDAAPEASAPRRGRQLRRRSRSLAREARRREAEDKARGLTPLKIGILVATVLLFIGILVAAGTGSGPGGGARTRSSVGGSASRPFPRKNGHRPPCQNCDGTGVDRGTWNQSIPQLCEECGGTGVSAMVPPDFGAGMGVDCPICGGSGWQEVGGGMVQQCPHCNGTGRLGGRADNW